MNLAVARDAIRHEITRLIADQARLQAVLRDLDGGAPEAAAPRPAKQKRRLRLKDDVATDISSKIVKAVKAHKNGASRADILSYLSRSGYEVGHHFNEPHLAKLVNTLVTAETPAIRREGDRANTRYFAAE